MMLGPVFGPVIGGLIVDSVSWRWIFYVNVPIGLLALALAYRVLARDERKGGERLDVLGLALLSPGLALLVYGLSEAGSHGTVTNASTVFGVLAGGALVAAFVLHALRTRAEALLDVRLFADRHFSAAAGTVFLFGVSLFGAMLLLPLYYQVVRDESALTAGLLLAPQGLGAAAAMPVAGRLTDRLGAGRIVPLGLLLALAGTLAYTQVGSDTSYALLAGSLVVRGLGLGATMMPSMAAAYQTLRRDQVPRAAPTLNIIMRVGGSLGTALLAVVLARFISSNIPGATGSLSTATSGARHAGAAAATPLADAFASTFWLAFALTAVALLPALLLPRRPVAPAAVTARAASP
jgi:EmrB/QacA subfamily drug resistance transporter